GVYHGPRGLRRIAERVRGWTSVLAAGLRELGLDAGAKPFFDTLRVALPAGAAARVLAAADSRRMNLRDYGDGAVGVSLDETTGRADVQDLIDVFAAGTGAKAPAVDALLDAADAPVPAPFARTSGYLEHEVFNRYHAEHELLRYIHRLQSRDLSLTTSMIPLGSCTMKLNASSEKLPVK